MRKPKLNTAKTLRDRKGRFAARGSGWRLLLALLAAFILALAIWWLDATFFPVIVSPVPEENYVSPVSKTEVRPAVKFAVVPVESKEERPEAQVSVLVEAVAAKYAHGDYEKYRLIYQLHCLLWKESNYYLNKAHGDNGLAGGALQFHEGTWVSFRREMMRQGLVAEIGSRYDLEQAVETAAWALAHGKGNHWGPIARGECR